MDFEFRQEVSRLRWGETKFCFQGAGGFTHDLAGPARKIQMRRFGETQKGIPKRGVY
jgi:hypothetical protein